VVAIKLEFPQHAWGMQQYGNRGPVPQAHSSPDDDAHVEASCAHSVVLLEGETCRAGSIERCSQSMLHARYPSAVSPAKGRYEEQ
jgi:hypothetical protein